MFIVYILFSESTQKFYTGQTQDFVNRIQEHNNGETLSIRKGIPWILVWKTMVDTRSQAVGLERKIKKRGAKRFIEDYTGNNSISLN